MSRKLSRNSRRVIVASLLGLTVGGGVLASAASLGINASTLGAGTTVIASCDTDGVSLKYGHTYVQTVPLVNPGSYRTSSVIVSGIAAACAGKAISVTLKDALGTSLVSATSATLTSPSTTLSFVAPYADAIAVVGAAVVIAD